MAATAKKKTHGQRDNFATFDVFPDDADSQRRPNVKFYGRAQEMVSKPRWWRVVMHVKLLHLPTKQEGFINTAFTSVKRSMATELSKDINSELMKAIPAEHVFIRAEVKCIIIDHPEANKQTKTILVVDSPDLYTTDLPKHIVKKLRKHGIKTVNDLAGAELRFLEEVLSIPEPFNSDFARVLAFQGYTGTAGGDNGDRVPLRGMSEHLVHIDDSPFMPNLDEEAMQIVLDARMEKVMDVGRGTTQPQIFPIGDPPAGTSFDDFLKEEGIHEEVSVNALAKVKAWLISESRQEEADRLETMPAEERESLSAEWAIKTC